MMVSPRPDQALQYHHFAAFVWHRLWNVGVPVVFHKIQEMPGSSPCTKTKAIGGISLLSILGKLYARVLLVHPQQLAECVYPESEGSMSRPFDIKSGVKQGCVLAPTLFEVLFSPLLKYTLTEVVQMHTRSEGRLYNITRLRAKTKVCETIQRHALCRWHSSHLTHWKGSTVSDRPAKTLD